ncbi:hypothetical protein TSOC_015262, partial [Tetrabaena socialis]
TRRPFSFRHPQRREAGDDLLELREAWDDCPTFPGAGTDPAPSAAAAAPPSAGAGGEAGTSGRPFMVRGRDYMRTKVKVASRGPLYQLMSTDVFSTDTKLTHVARHLNLAPLLQHLPGHGQGGQWAAAAAQQQQQGGGAGQAAGKAGSAAAASLEAAGPAMAGVDPFLPQLLIFTIMLPMYP